MIITDCSLCLMEKTDPQYPDPDPRCPFGDVYVFQFKADGLDMEVPFFVREGVPLTPEMANGMLSLFGRAILNLQAEQAA